jgi:hypothetical protein
VVNLIEMWVVQVQIHTVKEIYRLVWTAVENKQPIEAMYRVKGGSGYLPTSIGPESTRTTWRTLLSIRRGKPEWTPTGGLACKLALCCTGETQQGEVNGRCLAHGAESLAACFLCGRSGY